MESFFVSTAAVTLGEIGDKTQLLALLLAARFRRPVPILFGILCATLANHALAALIGDWVHRVVPHDWLRWGLGLSFLAVAAWALVPDTMGEEQLPGWQRSALVITLVTFFLAEVGDKTQIATMMLAARFGEFAPVLAGTTLGMLIADAPAVWLGERAGRGLPLTWIRRVAAALFAAIGIAIWMRVDQW